MLGSLSDWMYDAVKALCLEGLLNNLYMVYSCFASLLSGDNLAAGALLQTHPADYGGGNVWNIIQRLCNNTVVPLAGMVLVIILIHDLIQTIISNNNFNDFDVVIIFKWVVKSVCGIVLVSNVSYIVSGIFSIATKLATDARGALRFVTFQDPNWYDMVKNYSWGELIVIVLLSTILAICTFIMCAIIVVVVISRLIESFMLTAAAPIGMVTFMNSKTSSIGSNWIKNLLAVAFQGFFIIVAMTIFISMYTDFMNHFSQGKGVLLEMCILTGYSIALMFTILRSGNISKSIFDAH